MSEDLMHYDLLTQDALRGVVRLALERVKASGLPGDHHFFISFATCFPGVEISDVLLGKHPEEMTIVVQHQFWNLKVTDRRFEIELSFNNVPERLVVPYAAIKGFFDPSVQFGLQFVTSQENAAIERPEAACEANCQPAAPDSAASPPAASRPAVIGPSAKAAVGSGAKGKKGKKDTGKPASPPAAASETVVSLDAFRKK